MSATPAEQVNPESDLLPPGNRDVITEANWVEMKASRGFQVLIEQVDLDTPDGKASIKRWQDEYGREYIYTGSAFEWDERRPLDHKPGRGIYISGEGNSRWLEEVEASERQSSDTGPASS